MKDTWFTHNTDKLLLYSLVILGGLFMTHIIHHGNPDAELLTWLENAFSTVLGALILILTGRIQRANGSPTPDKLDVSFVRPPSPGGSPAQPPEEKKQ